MKSLRTAAFPEEFIKMSLDGFEMSKIGGAVLAALLVMLAPGTVGKLLAPAEHSAPAAPKSADQAAVGPAADPAKPADHGTAAAHPVKLGGYNLPLPVVAAETAAAGDGKAPAGFDTASVLKLLATAKPENGEATFKKCASCHAVQKGTKSGLGPNLWGLVGRKKGSMADYAGYSDAIKSKGGDWSYADLAAFLHDPKGWMPGTKMAINVADPAELADVLAYLRGLSDAPVALPQ